MPDLLYEKSDGVATLTLNRPDRKNAMSPEMLVLLADAWQAIEHDEEVRAVILTGDQHDQGTRARKPGKRRGQSLGDLRLFEKILAHWLDVASEHVSLKVSNRAGRR